MHGVVISLSESDSNGPYQLEIGRHDKDSIAIEVTRGDRMTLRLTVPNEVWLKVCKIGATL